MTWTTQWGAFGETVTLVCLYPPGTTRHAITDPSEHDARVGAWLREHAHGQPVERQADSEAQR